MSVLVCGRHAPFAAAAAVLGFHIFSFRFLNFLLAISVSVSAGIGWVFCWWSRGHDPAAGRLNAGETNEMAVQLAGEV
jgi:hypothetical protein